MRKDALLAISLTVAAVAAVATAGCGGGDESNQTAGEAEAGANAGVIPGLHGIREATVARRVEQLRGLKFRRLPAVEVVDERELERAVEKVSRKRIQSDPALADREERSAAAAEALLLLSGVVDSKSDVALLKAAGSDIGGIYIDQQDKLYLVRKLVGRSRRIAEIVIAHELIHALEDQNLQIFERSDQPLSDRSDAGHALIEGSATLGESEYASRYVDKDQSPQQILARRLRGIRKAKAPPGLQPAIGFPYIAGTQFASSLQRPGGWRAVTDAEKRPPESTEQILHPRKYLRREEPKRISIDLKKSLPSGWRRLGGGDLGELSTRMVLAAGVSQKRAIDAARGWAGGTFEIWYERRLPTIQCGQHCRAHTAAVLTWVSDTPQAGGGLRRALRAYLRAGVDATASGRDSWRVNDGAAMLVGHGPRTTLVFAPDERLAGRLAQSAIKASQPQTTERSDR
jgi:hypothetical protein